MLLKKLNMLWDEPRGTEHVHGLYVGFYYVERAVTVTKNYRMAGCS